MKWDYRIIEHDQNGQSYFAVHEVYYDEKGKIQSWTADPIEVAGDSKQEVLKTLKHMIEDTKQPELKESELEKISTEQAQKMGRTMIPSLKMNTGASIPQIGLGTWLMTDEEECKNAIKHALEIGYRHIDTAQAYNNEQFIGQAIKESGVSREDIFLTTKIYIENMGYKLIDSFEESLKKLQTNYVDLLLIHFPVTVSRRPSWRWMEGINKSGRAKNIGVSNYMINHLEELLRECEVRPSVNQFELHVFLQMPELVKYCKEQEIVVEAYSPLARSHKFGDPLLNKIAKKHKKTPAQIMIRWCIETGAVTIPKSVHKERIKENFAVFDFNLDNEDMAELKKLDSDYRVSWDPTHVP